MTSLLVRPAGVARGLSRQRPASEPPLTPADAVRILLGWQGNVRGALQWLHRDWLALALGIDAAMSVSAHVDAALASLRTRGDEACSLAVLRVLLPAPPTLDAFSIAPATRLDALPIETGLRVLRMLALLARRMEVRRLIDRTTRQRLAEWIGCPLDALLAKTLPEAPSLADAKRERAATRALGALDADELALEGLAWLPRIGTDGMLLRLALPRMHRELGAADAAPAEEEREDVFALLRERIGPLLPEYAWLSG